MSDNWLRYAPTDPSFQPTEQAAEGARELLRKFLPQAEEVTAVFFERPTFIDPGTNWSGVMCAACGADAESWWEEAVSAASENGFASLETVSGCCQARVSLNELRYVWPSAFGRFVLDAMNPNVRELSAAQLELLGAAVGCSVREIPQHL